MAEKNFRFKRGKIKQPSQERINRVKDKSINSFGLARSYWNFAILHLSAMITFYPTMLIIIRKFFLIQYFRKAGLRRIPVKNVDHDLDKKIPFKPETLHTYLDFINYWIRPMTMISHRFGSYTGIKLNIEFLKYIRLIYNSAYKIYSKHMSTTTRPQCEIQAIKNLQFWDPHYLCVPSLHISVICLTYSFYRNIFERENFTEEEKIKWNKELYEHGIEIADSVLYMKQHSVNCIGAALYLVTKVTPELFTKENAREFISDLLKTSNEIESQDVKQIQEHIQKLYDTLCNATQKDDEWDKVIIEYIKNY